MHNGRKNYFTSTVITIEFTTNFILKNKLYVIICRAFIKRIPFIFEQYCPKADNTNLKFPRIKIN